MNGAVVNWFQLTIKNCFRRKFRTFTTIFGVMTAVAALFSLLSFQRGYQAGMRTELDRLGAHVLVVPKGCPYDAASMALHGASWPCYLKSAYLKQVRGTEGVADASPMLMNAVYDQATGDQSVYIGSEPGLLRIKRNWRLDGSFPDKSGECLLGSIVARKLHLAPGDSFKLPGISGEKGRVVGVLNGTQSADDTFIYVPLSDAQRIFKRPEQLTHILVRLKDPDTMDKTVGLMRGCDAGMDMNVVPLAHLFETIQNLVNSTRTFLASLALIALLIAGAGVSNTILMAVAERTQEIGMMRAVGASSLDIFRLIWLETMLICTAGGLAGVAFALIGASEIEALLRERLPFSPTEALIRPEIGVIGFCLLCAILLGTVAGLLPAWRAALLSPIQAIRAGN